MRDLKFRAWDKDNNIWVGRLFLDQLHIRMDGSVWWFSHKGWENVSDMFEVTEYAELKDKNGVDICEGDIVSILYTDWPSNPAPNNEGLEEYKDSISNIGKVVFIDCAFKIQFNEDGYANSIHCGKHGQIKVIGNIYENPELLNA